MKKGQHVSMDIRDEYTVLMGVTIEDACHSATQRDPERMVIRVRWEDGSETIENVNDLY